MRSFGKPGRYFRIKYLMNHQSFLESLVIDAADA